MRKTLLAGCWLLLSPAAQAGMLCDESCTLVIDFPAGGSIAATAPLVFYFGDGGLVDTVGSVTAYLAGDTLPLDAGQALDFEAGGRFDLGAAGNIDFTDLTIATDGTVDIGVSGGAERVIVEAGSRLVLGGEISLQGAIAFQVDGILEIDAGGELHSSEPGDPAGASLQNASGGSITIGGGSLFDDPVTGTTLNDALTIESAGGFDPGEVLVTLNAGSEVLPADSLLTIEPPPIVDVSGQLDLLGDDDSGERRRHGELESALGVGWMSLLTLGLVAGWRGRRQSAGGRRTP